MGAKLVLLFKGLDRLLSTHFSWPDCMRAYSATKNTIAPQTHVWLWPWSNNYLLSPSSFAKFSSSLLGFYNIDSLGINRCKLYQQHYKLLLKIGYFYHMTWDLSTLWSDERTPVIVSPVRSTYGGYYGLVVVTPPPPPPRPRPQTLHRSHDNLKNPYRIASIFYM